MDLTLNQIIKKVDLISCNISKINNIISQTEIKKYLIELNNILNQVQIVSAKTLNIYNICKNTYIMPTIIHRLKLNTDIDISNQIFKQLPNNNTENTIYKQLTHDIPVCVKIVDNIKDIPFTPLYWVTQTNQFAININGVILRGSVGNIYDKTHIQSNKIINQVVICKKNNLCQNVLNNEICKFYHDPEDLLKLVNLNKISIELFNKYKTLNRNYLNTDWIYTNRYNNSMRHFGSRNTLNYECDMIKFNNITNNQKKSNDILNDIPSIKNFKQQCMHDILVIMGLNQVGLII
jgi:hypothetical protein